MFKRSRFGRRFALMALLLCIWPSIADEPKLGSDKSPDRISVIVDYGDGVEKRFTALTWKKDMTVFGAMQAAQAHPRGIRFEYQGKGSTTLLTKIDDLANEGRGRNWVYRVNGKLAEESCGTRQLAAGDSVLWKFEVYR